MNNHTCKNTKHNVTLKTSHCSVNFEVRLPVPQHFYYTDKIAMCETHVKRLHLHVKFTSKQFTRISQVVHEKIYTCGDFVCVLRLENTQQIKPYNWRPNTSTCIHNLSSKCNNNRSSLQHLNFTGIHKYFSARKRSTEISLT